MPTPARRYLLEDHSGYYLIEPGNSGTYLIEGATCYRDAVLADSPTAYWRLGEATGVFADSTGRGHNGYVTGSPGRNVADPFVVGGDDGAITTSALADFVRVPAHADLDLGDGPFSIEAIVRIDGGDGTFRVILSKGTGAYNLGIWNPSNTFFLGIPGVTIVVQSAAAYLAGPGVYHIVATHNGTGAGNTLFYVNGVEGHTDVDTSQHAGNASNDLVIGHDWDPGPLDTWNGLIDEVAVYKTVLSAGQVAAHYQAAITACYPLVGGETGLTWDSQHDRDLGQQRSTAQRWYQPDTEVLGSPPRPSAYAGADIGWSAEQDRSTAQTWFAPEASVEGLTPPPIPFDPSLVGWGYDSGQDAWDPGKWTPMIADTIGVSTDLPRAWLADNDAQQERVTQGTWFRPDDPGESPLPPAGFDPSTLDVAWDYDAGQDRDASARWFAPDAAADVPSQLPNAPTLPDFGWDGSQDQWRPSAWFQPDTEVLGDVPRPNASEGAELAEQPQDWRPVVWFQPDTESWTPIPKLTVATVDQQAPLWQEQPADWRPETRFVHEDGILGQPPAPAAFDPATIDWGYDASQDRSTQPVWAVRDEPALGDVPRVNAPSGLDFGWDAGQDRSTQPTWFQPDTEALVRPPAAFDPATVDWGWDAGQDRSVQPVWFQAPDPQESPAPPLPYVDSGWDAQHDRSTGSVWFQPDTAAIVLGAIVISLVTGGPPPVGSAVAALPSLAAMAALPASGATEPQPGTSATGPTPSSSATSPTPR